MRLHLREPEPARLIPLPPPPRPTPWYARRTVWLGAGLAVVLLIAAVAALKQVSPAPSPAVVAIPSPAAMTAHGVVRPARSARVGTQGGGVVQTLLVADGDRVQAQQELAVIQGPTGAEVLTAPLAGIATDVPVHLGDTVLPGALVASVGDLSSYVIETTDVDQYVVAEIHAGQTVLISVDAIPQRRLMGMVRSVAFEPRATTAGGAATYATIITVPSPPADLRAGMVARVSFVR